MASVNPTKGNLIQAKKSLALARTGYDILDRKRNILIREIMNLLDDTRTIRSEIDKSYADAYLALQKANVTLGICDEISRSVNMENGLRIDYRSIMGVELPEVYLERRKTKNPYGYFNTNEHLDEAFLKFDKVKQLTVRLAQIENCIFRLAVAIKKTQKRANALKNIVIPRFENTIAFVSEALEEKEREEFSRMKVIKNNK